jgi:4-amino-4-deoxy-L-arabinose transferase-like glycosyltransferase
MFHRLQHRGWHYLLLTTVSGILFFANLGGPTLWDIDEGRNLTCAFEMREANNWVVPTFNGKLRPDKPVLLYWLQIIAYEWFGVNEFAGRLPSALAALVTVLLCYEVARSMFSRPVGLLAGIVVATAPMLSGAAHFANPDGLLNVCVVLTLALFWFGYERPTLCWYAALGAAEGLGMLAKGPVAVVIPTGIIAAFLIWERRWKALIDWRQIAAVFAFIVVAVPWYALVTAETKGEFAAEFFLKHNRDRVLSPMENHAGAFWYYPVVLVFGALPWSIFLVPALWHGLRSCTRQANAAGADLRGAAYRLLVCWAVLWIGCFTVAATKLPNYVLPAVAPIAILTAVFLERWRQGEARLPSWVMPASLACLAIVGVGLAIGLLVASGLTPFNVTRGRSFPSLAPWALLGIVPIMGSAIAGWFLRNSQRTEMLASVAVSALLLFAPLWAWAIPALNVHKSPQPLAELSGANHRHEDIRVVTWNVDHLPSLSFYVGRHIEVCASEWQVATFLEYPLPVYAFLPAPEWEALQPKLNVPCRELGRHEDLYKRVETVVITNR